MLKRPRILIVDDFSVMHKIVERSLGHAGFELGDIDCRTLLTFAERAHSFVISSEAGNLSKFGNQERVLACNVSRNENISSASAMFVAGRIEKPELESDARCRGGKMEQDN
jgi:hypothetical protein